jgi:2,3-bisphosphoglycerate-dependent phosphoglycerate mutase
MTDAPRARTSNGNVLVLVRHGESEWNKRNLFTGWKDPDLSQKGIDEARAAGARLRKEGFVFDVAFTSELCRAEHTLDIILAELGEPALPTHRDVRLNERDYGALSGLNKDDARKRWGEEQVHLWRRSYDIAPPEGESLKDTAARVLPYYDAAIAPELLAGRNVLVVAHGNSLRALIMRLERLSGEEIVKRELGTGVPLVYRLKSDGTMATRRDLA